MTNAEMDKALYSLEKRLDIFEMELYNHTHEKEPETACNERYIPAVGDIVRVRAKDGLDGRDDTYGMLGIVRVLADETTSTPIGVEFLAPSYRGHDLDGMLSNKRGRWGHALELEFITKA